ncbi:MAG: hypothetical protein QMD04_07220 [Anaerolineales bacterium]|nr:hypothetical protein [Anaerolineales bacterium]
MLDAQELFRLQLDLEGKAIDSRGYLIQHRDVPDESLPRLLAMDFGDVQKVYWVFTLPEERGQGYARRVTLAWEQYLKVNGKIPFYSHKRENLPSQRLAASMKLIKIYEQAGYG